MAKKDRTVRDYIRPGTEEHGRLREDFNFTDLDKDGRLTLGEFIRFMSTLDPAITSEECSIGFDEIDTDHDGAIEFDEFFRWWSER